MEDFRDKTAVITGAASGIGLALAGALARKGARLVLADIEAGALASAVASIRSEGTEAIGLATDVSDRSAMHRLADKAWSEFGSVHLVAHNAGVVYYGPIVEMSPQDWEWLLSVNLWGAINGVNAFLSRMLESGEAGHMLFTSSAAGLSTYAGTAAYGMTKAAVISLAEGLDTEHRDDNIAFSVLCPMHVATNLRYSNRNRPPELGGRTANSEAVAKRQPGLHSDILSANAIAEMTLAAMQRGEFYIHTHAAAEARVEERARRVREAFASIRRQPDPSMS